MRFARDPAALPDVLDHGCETARRAWPWFGVLWLGVLPLRLAQAHLVAEAARLGSDAKQHVPYFVVLGAQVAAALVLATLARSVFVRALTLTDASGAPPGREGWRVGLGPACAHLVLAAGLGVLGMLSAPLFVAWPIMACLTGAAAVVSLRTPRGDGFFEPAVRLLRALEKPVALGGLLLVFTPAILLAALNLHVLATFGTWAYEGVDVASAASWRALLSPSSVAYDMVLLSGALMIVEPFWLGCHVALQARLEQRSTGEDLRLAFRRAWSAS